MPKLKMRTRTVQEVNAFDLEVFVREITGKEWNFAAAEEAGNDTDHSFSVSASLREYESAEIDGFLAGDAARYPSGQTMLDWLASAGHILPGNYLVRLSW